MVFKNDFEKEKKKKVAKLFKAGVNAPILIPKRVDEGTIRVQTTYRTR
jgi:hypothetical protein